MSIPVNGKGITSEAFYEVENINLTEEDKRKWRITADSCYFLVRYFIIDGFRGERVGYELLAPFNFDSEGHRARRYLRQLQGLPDDMG